MEIDTLDGAAPPPRDDPADADAKTEARKERNRKHSARSRERMMATWTQLRCENEALRNENAKLRAKVARLETCDAAIGEAVDDEG